MKRQSLLAFSFITSAAIFFSSCQKNIQDKKVQDEIVGTPLPGQQTYCRVESIWEHPNPIKHVDRYILILYNEFENPVAITAPVILTDVPYRTFKYDQWHRLREYRGEYGNGYTMLWHLYGYDNAGRIAYDTVYTFAQIVNEQPVGSQVIRMSTIEYDSQNRISKVVTSSNVSEPQISTYNYDAAGNLIRPGVVYDNKLNIHRTNDIWMFLARDYSVNNPTIADEYNIAGYPTKTNSPYPFADTEISLFNTSISYGCRQAFW